MSARLGRICLPLVAAAMLVGPSHSFAAANPIASGRTELHLGERLVGKLERARAKVVPKGTTIAISSSTFVFEVAGGALDPTSGAGDLILADGIAFKRGRRAVGIRDIRVETSAGLVVAKVGGQKMWLGHFTSVASAEEGFGVSVSVPAISLSGVAARKLDQVLHLEGRARLRGGQAFGALEATTQPGAMHLMPNTGYGALSTGQGYPAFDKLRSRQVFFRQIAPAIPHYSYPLGSGLPTAVSFYLPSVTGWIAPDGKSGELELAGGIALEGESRSPTPVIRVQRIVLNLATGSVGAELSRDPLPLPVAAATPILTATGNPGVVLDPETRTFSIYVSPVALTADFADSLDETFQASLSPPAPESILAGGESLGELSVRAVAR